MNLKAFTVVPLICAIVFISWGIGKGDLFMCVLGGFCAGIYNSIISKTTEE